MKFQLGNSEKFGGRFLPLSFKVKDFFEGEFSPEAVNTVANMVIECADYNHNDIYWSGSRVFSIDFSPRIGDYDIAPPHRDKAVVIITSRDCYNNRFAACYLLAMQDGEILGRCIAREFEERIIKILRRSGECYLQHCVSRYEGDRDDGEYGVQSRYLWPLE